MTIYWMETHIYAVAGGETWSETTARRKPARDVERWYNTDADRAPLGPLPPEILSEINAHWALSLVTMDPLPDTIGQLGAAHFTGAPFARKHVCDVFEEYSEGNCQIIPIRKFWSLADKAEVPEPYYVANVYTSTSVIDPDKTPLRKVENPKMGKLFFPGSRSEKKCSFEKEVLRVATCCGMRQRQSGFAMKFFARPSKRSRRAPMRFVKSM